MKNTLLFGGILFLVTVPQAVSAQIEDIQYIATWNSSEQCLDHDLLDNGEELSSQIYLFDRKYRNDLEEVSSSSSCLVDIESDKETSLVPEAKERFHTVRSTFSPEIVASQVDTFADQWALENTGQEIVDSEGKEGEDINFTKYQDSVSSTQETTTIAIVDTGVSQSGGLKGTLLEGKDIITDSPDGEDVNGHGTFIASTITGFENDDYDVQGINERVRILPVRVLEDKGTGKLSDLIKGIEYAVEQDVDIINLSLVTEYTETLDPVIEKAQEQGITVIAAMGNKGEKKSEKSVSPVHNGRNDFSVIGVSSYDNQGNTPDFANTGSGVDTKAPGKNILGYFTEEEDLVYQSGTSLSAGITSGVISRWRDVNGDLDPEVFYTYLRQSEKLNMMDGVVTTSVPDGLLVTSPKSGVSLVKDGVKRPIVDPDTFLSQNYNWDDIVELSNEDYNAVPMGPVLDLRDGTLISDGTGVFVVENGLRRPITSADIFRQQDYRWDKIWMMSEAVLDMHPLGEMLNDGERVLDGSVITAEGEGVYLIEDGERRSFPDRETYLSHYQWSDVRTISQDQFDSLPLGARMKPRDGAIMADEKTVYLINDGRKRPFYSADAYLDLGLGWGRVVTPESNALSRLSRGEVIQ